ncbi:MAG: hypothetical protein WC773_02330 [Patescibacteria group bacterium]|jgi:hypothetical protein
MKRFKKIFKLGLSVVVYPLISLAIVYGLFMLMDKNINRVAFETLAVFALALPGVTLALGIYHLTSKHRLIMSVIASALSALIWVIVAYLMRSNGLFDPLTPTNAFWLWLVYAPYIFSLLVIIEMVRLAFRLKRKD